MRQHESVKSNYTGLLWIYIQPLLVCAILIFLLTACSGQKDLQIRKFPYPYKAALAICSDIDETESIEEFLEMQEFLNTKRRTRYGTGLGLEIGNSFWFYNQFVELKQSGEVDSLEYSGNLDLGISLFKGSTDSLN